MPGGRPRSDRKGSPFCAGKEGAKSVERVVKVLGPLLAPAGNAREPRPAALWLLARLCSACLRHGHGRELVSELASAGMAEHRQPGAGLAGMGDGGGHSIDESIGSAKGGRQTAPKAETIASLEF